MSSQATMLSTGSSGSTPMPGATATNPFTVRPRTSRSKVAGLTLLGLACVAGATIGVLYGVGVWKNHSSSTTSNALQSTDDSQGTSVTVIVSSTASATSSPLVLVSSSLSASYTASLTSTASPTSTPAPPSSTARPRLDGVPTGSAQGLPPGYAGRIVRKCNNDDPRVVALTFDDGPTDYTDAVLTALAVRNVTATFFLNAQNWGCIYEAGKVATMRRMLAAGHQLASHTYSHQDLSTLSEVEIRNELTRLEDALRTTVGVVPAFLRPPYGATNPLSLTVTEDLGYVNVLWDIDSHDSQLPATWTAAGAPVLTLAEQQTRYRNYIANFFYEAQGGGHIILSHDTSAMSPSVLVPFVLDWLAYNQYRPVPLGECLGLSDPTTWYKELTAPGTRTLDWVCTV